MRDNSYTKVIKESSYETLKYVFDLDLRMTFVHELAHNFGAAHDEDVDDEECQEKGYIMTDIVEGEDLRDEDKLKNRNHFSDCSIKAMKRKLAEIKCKHIR